MSVFKLGLTGSIGMGKSTTAQMFQEAGCALWDADAAVHRLYAPGGLAVSAIVRAFPQLSGQTEISRSALRSIIAQDQSALTKIEAIVHPLVAQDRADFLNQQTKGIVVLDNPLLFETGGETKVDAVACVDVSTQLQEERVLARGTMTKEEFVRFRDKQMQNSEKVARSDYVIITDTLDHARRQVHDVLADIRGRMNA